MLTTLPLASGLLLSDFHPTTTNIRDLRREIRAAADRCAIAETTGLYALVNAILLIFVAPGRFVNILMNTIG